MTTLETAPIWASFVEAIYICVHSWWGLLDSTELDRTRSWGKEISYARHIITLSKGRTGQLCRLATDCSNEQLLDGPGDRQPINVTLSAFKCEDWTDSALIPPTHLPKGRTTPVSSPKCQFIKSNWHVTNNWQRWADEIETDSWMDTA